MNRAKENEVKRKLHLLADSFQSVLYEEDKTFLENMKTKSLVSDEIGRAHV